MSTYEYVLVKMEPVYTDADTVESILNERGEEGYRFCSIQKLWTESKDGESIQRNYLILEKVTNDEL
jgi:hypothetical protein